MFQEASDMDWQPIATLPECSDEWCGPVLVWSSRGYAVLCDEPPKHLETVNSDLTHWLYVIQPSTPSPTGAK